MEALREETTALPLNYRRHTTGVPKRGGGDDHLKTGVSFDDRNIIRLLTRG
jgi:hypothetical protein